MHTAKPTLLCLSGWGFSTAIWDSVTLSLADTFNVVAKDLSGLTDIETWANDLLANLPESFYVLGWSLGGVLAQYLAKHFPKRIRAVLALASTPFFPASDAWPGIDGEQWQAFNGLKDITQQLKQFSRWQVPIRDRSAMQKIRESLLSTEHAEALQKGLHYLSTLDCREWLKQTPCPCFFLLAGQDALLPVSLADALPGDVNVLSEATHAALVTHPDAVSSWVKGVLCE